jgi:hypothetical protein
VKPLLVGEMPSRSGDRYWRFPLSGAVAQTMCKMTGIPPMEEGSRYGRWTWALYEHFDCIDAIERYSKWDSEVAAARLLEKIEPEREVVVLLGRRAQTAYVRMYSPSKSTIHNLPYWQWRMDILSDTSRRQVAVIPHPSTRNRLYEHSDPRLKSGLVLREAIEKAQQLEETML